MRRRRCHGHGLDHCHGRAAGQGLEVPEAIGLQVEERVLRIGVVGFLALRREELHVAREQRRVEADLVLHEAARFGHAQSMHGLCWLARPPGRLTCRVRKARR